MSDSKNIFINLKVIPLKQFMAIVLVSMSFLSFRGEDGGIGIETRAPYNPATHTVNIRSNLLPWIAAIPNIGAEITLSRQWSAVLDVWYSPWKISERYSIKTVEILPEVRWWFRDCSGGSYLNLHLTCGWYNVRWGSYRYQDADTPMLGGGIGYGYKLRLNGKWSFEFTIGAGYFTSRSDKFYNRPNGALMETRKINYFGIDRAGVSVVYNIGDL